MFGALLLAAFAASIPLATAQTTCAYTTPANSSPTKPASDPFWSAPSNINSLQQGNVFNCRGVNWNKVDGAQAYYQYAYKTVLSDGRSVVAVATLLIPDGTTPFTKFSKLLSYQIPYDSPTSFCGPSFVFQPFSGPSTSATYSISNVTSSNPDYAPSQALKAGIPVVISDYETSFASFTVGVTEGYGTLNGIRAVIQSSGFFNSKPQVALWGYSGGALATEFALELASSYSDLNIIGAAIGGLTPITRNVAIKVNGRHDDPSNPAQTFYNALIPYAALGIANENATFSQQLQRDLNDQASEPGAPNQANYKARFNNAATDNCNIGTGPDFVNSNFSVGWFKFSDNPFNVPYISDALNKYGIMGQTVSGQRSKPTMPIYVYKGTADEVSDVRDTDALVNGYCGGSNGNGAKITYVRLNGKTHADAQTSGFNGAWGYLRDRFGGVAAPTKCSTNTV